MKNPIAIPRRTKTGQRFDLATAVLKRGLVAARAGDLEGLAAIAAELAGEVRDLERAARRCTWSGCPRPEEPVTGRSETGEPIHAACRHARNEAARRCTWAHCPTPDVPLHASARKCGSTMHRACVGLARRKPRPTACACGRPLAGPTAKLCRPCAGARRAAGRRGGGRRPVPGRSVASELLRASGRTLGEVVRLLGGDVARASVSKWQTGRATPAPAHREALHAALAIPVVAWSQPAPESAR